MDRASLRRLRWRLRGAWMWPAFLVLTPVAALLVHANPISGDDTGFVPALLLAGFLNLLAVAVLAPLLALALRRRRPDLPTIVARDDAGAALVVVVTAALAVAGALHAPAVDRAHARERARASAVHDFVVGQAPAEYRARLALADTVRIDAALSRTCIPGAAPRRRLCLYVDTSQDPPGIRVDPSRSPNDELRTVYP